MVGEPEPREKEKVLEHDGNILLADEVLAQLQACGLSSYRGI